jgi:ABC-type nitrate/sulfonate/bicarbonate transport system permease component
VTTADRLGAVPRRSRPGAAGLARRAARLLPALLLPLGGVAAWQLVAWLADPRPWLLPSPLDVLRTMAAEHDRLWFHAQGTIRGSLLGLALALAAGLALAVGISASRALDRAVYPWVVASQAIPILAVAPLFPIWLDYGPSQLLVAALIAFFPIVVTGVDGLRAVDPEIARTLRTLGAGRLWVWRHATFPAALPALFSGLRMAAVFSVTGAVVAEYVGADRGLGYLSEIATGQFQTDVVFACIAWLGAIGVALFGLVTLAERLVLPYRYRSTRPRWRTG